MGQRGPKPKPTQLKLVQGTYRKDRVPPDEVVTEPMTEIVPPPGFLSGAARKEWQRLMPKLVKLKLFSQEDVDALVEYCQALAMQREAALDVQKRGNLIKITRVIRTSNQTREITEIVPNPSVAQFAQLHPIVNRGMQRFGLNPADRTRVSPSGTAPKAKNKFQRYVGRGKDQG